MLGCSKKTTCSPDRLTVAPLPWPVSAHQQNFCFVQLAAQVAAAQTAFERQSIVRETAGDPWLATWTLNATGGIMAV